MLKKFLPQHFLKYFNLILKKKNLEEFKLMFYQMQTLGLYRIFAPLTGPVVVGSQRVTQS